MATNAHSEITHSTPESLDALRVPLDRSAVLQADQAAREMAESRLAASTGLDGPRFAAHVGLDLSLTATGLAAWMPVSRAPVVTSKITTDPADYRSVRDAKDRPAASYADRLNRLEDILASIEDRIPPGSLVFLEAPSYGSNTSGTFDRSGLWWLTYQRLTALSCRVVPVAPTQRMLYATGKGRADKDQVISAVVRRYPDLDVVDNNVADAVVLMAMAARAAGQPMEDSLPAANLKAMDKLEAI